MSSEKEIRCQADSVGLRKYGGLRYFKRVSYVYTLLYPVWITGGVPENVPMAPRYSWVITPLIVRFPSGAPLLQFCT